MSGCCNGARSLCKYERKGEGIGIGDEARQGMEIEVNMYSDNEIRT